MSTHVASCSCGQLRIACEGTPARISICFCTACQRRTGSAFGQGAYFPNEQSKSIEGASKIFERRSEAGRWLRFHFCGDCGSTVYWEAEFRPRVTGVAGGMFADQAFLKPTLAFWTESKMSWAPRDIDIHERQA
jgi:hypothetical protein